MERKALLAVSFGTSYADTLEKNIAAIEADLAAAFPERTLRRAFTSGMILRRWKRERGVEIDDVPAALERLEREGYTDILVQPTHVMNGEEYHKLADQAEEFRGRFDRLTVGMPLLTAAEDYLDLGKALLEILPPQAEDRAVIYMGHGSEHQANSAYALMEYAFHDLGRSDVIVGTVEGYPDFAAALRRLKERPEVKEVELRPLMTVAGDHAKNDLAGEEPDSWKNVLEGLGYRVNCVLDRPGGVSPGAGTVCGARQTGPGVSLFEIEGREKGSRVKVPRSPAAVREEPPRTMSLGRPGKTHGGREAQAGRPARSGDPTTYEV